MFHSRRNREYWNACKEVQTEGYIIDIQRFPLSSPHFRRQVGKFLAANGLRLESVDDYFCVTGNDGSIIAGAGLYKDIIKCVAVDPASRSLGLLGPLVSHVISYAGSKGISNLKVFTKPENEDIFNSLGFHALARAPKAILMENGRGLEDYLKSLSAAGSGGSTASLRSAPPLAPLHSAPVPPLNVPRVAVVSPSGLAADIFSGESLRIGGSSGVIVMNANPFTLGHQYLVRKAAESVDRLFVIPVKEDVSFFPYLERLEMIRKGCDGLATVLEGSDYQISAATFPTYFLKDLSDASETQMRLDIDLFGRHIAPALGATMRFVGSEPSDPLTARYNEFMKEMLPEYEIQVVEIPRLSLCESGQPSGPGRVHSRLAAAEYGLSPEADTDSAAPVSASLVRKALNEGSFRKAAALCPKSTWPYLVAELIARALRMELVTPLKPGLVDKESNGSHTDMDYDLMLGSIDVIRRSFVRHFHILTGPDEDSLSAFGKAIEADVLEYTNGVNTYRGAIFALGLASIAILGIEGGTQLFDFEDISQYVCADNQSDNSRKSLEISNLHTTDILLMEVLSRLAGRIEQGVDSNGGRIVKEHDVKGALQMAREGYRPLFEDWLPFYRSLCPDGDSSGRPCPDGIPADTLRLQKTLLRIMSTLDDTCVIHRVGYQMAQDVKKDAKDLLDDFSLEGLKEMKARYDSRGISPGGAADMLALTILIDSLTN